MMESVGGWEAVENGDGENACTAQSDIPCRSE